MNTQSLHTYRSDLIVQISEINQFSVLDKIHQVIGSELLLSDYEDALRRYGLPDKILNEFTTILNNASGTLADKLEFVSLLEKHSLVDVNALLKPEMPFRNSFATSFAAEMFINTAKVGKGVKMAGPGEYSLVGFSPNIEFAEGRGDIMINGAPIEVKAAMGRQGGRLGEAGYAPSRNNILDVIASHSPKLASYIETKKSLALIPFLEEVAPRMNLIEASNLLCDVVDLTLPGHGQAVANVFANCRKDYCKVEIEYMKQNYIWYKESHKFDSILALAFGARKTFNIQVPEQLAALRQNGKLGSPSISIWPSKPLEVFAQLNFTAKT